MSTNNVAMPSIHDLPRRVHRPLGLGLHEDTGERFYEIEGVRYPTVAEAGVALGMPPHAVYQRCQSSNYPDWIQHGRREGGKKDPEQAAAEAAEAREARKDPITPRQWKFDGGRARKPILDPNVDPPKVIGHVGWVKCLKCWSWCFSGDVARQRRCYECFGEASPRLADDGLPRRPSGQRAP